MSKIGEVAQWKGNGGVDYRIVFDGVRYSVQFHRQELIGMGGIYYPSEWTYLEDPSQFLISFIEDLFNGDNKAFLLTPR